MTQNINFKKEQTVWHTHAKGGNSLNKGTITSAGPRFITVDIELPPPKSSGF